MSHTAFTYRSSSFYCMYSIIHRISIVISVSFNSLQSHTKYTPIRKLIIFYGYSTIQKPLYCTLDHCITRSILILYKICEKGASLVFPTQKGTKIRECRHFIELSHSLRVSQFESESSMLPRRLNKPSQRLASIHRNNHST